MLADILRFNGLATALAEAAHESALREPIGEFLARHRFSNAFRDWYFLPMIGCIWSCPTDQMLRFPLATLVRFCHNHGLLQITGRPQWFTVVGGARQYVSKIVAKIADARLATPVRKVSRLPVGQGPAGVMVATDHGSERFDDVVLACHADQSLALLSDANYAQRSVLGAIRYHPNRAVLHTDIAQLPQRKRAWAAWNYVRASGAQREQAGVCLHYLINRLQPLPWAAPLIVSLNPDREPDARHVLGSWDYSHPVFDLAATQAQARLPDIQGKDHVWFAGAWTRYGFHEDGLMSALTVVGALQERWGVQAPARSPVQASRQAA